MRQWVGSSLASQPRMALVGKHRLLKVTTNGRAGAQHPGHLLEHLDRPHQVVHRDAAGGGGERGVGERQRRVDVQVLHDAGRRHRVGVELVLVQAEHGQLRPAPSADARSTTT